MTLSGHGTRIVILLKKTQKMLTPDILKSLAPTGTLRAGVYTGNFLLITGKTPEGDPDGVSPDLCRAIAQKLGVPLKLIPFKSQDASGTM